jgi:hypothetical protein
MRRDCNLKVETDRLVDTGFARYFVMGSLKVQLWLFGDSLVNWLGIFCMARIMYRKDAFSRNRYCDLLSIPGMKRKIFCIVRKGEKQMQILDGY